MFKKTIVRFRLHPLPLGILLASCATDDVSLGEERAAQNLEALYPEALSRCSESSILEETVLVTDQAELDPLRGCEEIRGDLTIRVFDDTDLSPLASLRAVVGVLHVGALPFTQGTEFESPEALDQEIERLTQIVAAGWLPSFHGIEALERVGALQLEHFDAPDLQAFAALRVLGGHHEGTQGGVLRVGPSARLVDFAGLEGVTGISRLIATENVSLESLAGIRLGSFLEGALLRDNPRLSNLDPLGTVVGFLGELTIDGTGARDLNALGGNFRTIERLTIANNAELVDISGIGLLTSGGELNISGNSKLKSIPSFSSLGFVSSIRVVDNAELESFSLNSSLLRSSALSTLSFEDRQFPRGADLILISRNPKLQSISSPGGFIGASVMAVHENASLASIDFGTLQRLDLLSIEGNPGLSQIGLGQLQAVDTMEVRDNPALSIGALASVPTFESTFTGNADEPPRAP
jgi:hypothetical protein